MFCIKFSTRNLKFDADNNIFYKVNVLQGILDRQHFIQVEYLEDGGDPNFVKDYIGVYLSDSLKNLNAIEQAL